MMSAPDDKAILGLIKKRPMTVSELCSLYDRQDRNGIPDIIDGLIKAQYVERVPGTIYDGPEYRITARGEAYL